MKQWKTSNPCNLKFEATRTRERAIQFSYTQSVCVCVCVCEREREREKRSVPKRCSIVVEEWETTSIDRKEKKKNKTVSQLRKRCSILQKKAGLNCDCKVAYLLACVCLVNQKILCFFLFGCVCELELAWD